MMITRLRLQARDQGSRLPAFAGLTILLTAAGCASFGGNVKGNFACQAPSGICAPTTKIDDQALAAMGAQDWGGTPMQPASNISRHEAHSPTALKVVLPARRDRFGRWREASVVYIEPDLAVAFAGGDEVTAGIPRQSLSDLAAGAPELAALPVQRPAAKTADIKAQVDAVLAKSVKRGTSPAAPTAPATGTVVAVNAVSGGSGEGAVVSAPAFPAPGTAGEF